MNDVVPLNKRGTRAVGYSVGGAGLLILSMMTHGFLLPLIAGGAVFVVGTAVGASKDKADRNVGLGIMGAGLMAGMTGLAHLTHGIPVLGGLLGFFGGISSFVLGAGGIGMLGYGIYNLIKFRGGLKGRG